MIANQTYRRAGVTIRGQTSRARAFTLVELLTVLFIISLLIAILIPALSGARTAAKRTVTGATLNALKTGLEMFKNDNERAFRQSNGYAPSFSHPPVGTADFDPALGQYPFIPGTALLRPTVYGAHWLPAMLVGYDASGAVRPTSVPLELRNEPWKWYTGDPLNNGSGPLDRMALYVDPSTIPMIRTVDLPGSPNLTDFFPDWDDMNTLPVIVDAFDQPILYYAANRYGTPQNMLADTHDPTGEDFSPAPYYFHQDNEGFTGSTEPGEEGEDGQQQEQDEPGWNFGGGGHAIAAPGNLLNSVELVLPEYKNSFARYILDRRIWSIIQLQPVNEPLLRPVNPDSYLLISAGPDAIYGTNDDVSNLPPWPD